MMLLVTGAVGVGLLAAFTGFMLWWVPAPPLIIIVGVVMLLLLYDWINTLRYGNIGSGR